MLPHQDYKIEVCVASYEQALTACSNGADRLELCSRLQTEGMTPDLDLAMKILDLVNIPVRIMIRETEIGFENDARILDKMENAIHQFKSLPVEGFVFGMLKDRRIDQDAMKQLIESSSPYPITVHKAIDSSQHIREDVLWLNQFATVDTLLTSGGKETAVEGVAQILKMKSIFRGNIMAAGKITYAQLSFLNSVLGLTWYHGRNILSASGDVVKN